MFDEHKINPDYFAALVTTTDAEIIAALEEGSRESFVATAEAKGIADDPHGAWLTATVAVYDARNAPPT